MERELKKILFATDLSNNCRNAFTYAASLSSRYAGAITLLHVMESLPDSVDAIISGFIGQEKWKDIHKQQQNDARMTLIGKRNNQTMIHDAMDAFSKDENITDCAYTIDKILVKDGHVVDTIIETSIKENCDLIIMGSHKGLFSSGTALGQVAKGVLKQSKIPVMVIPPVE
ncbi:MAG: universal stress protein [Desulfamplus sp.]|nr:universal stress protein [Desulfamplus sp.]MBF0412427.1 universal stress protein [Desulfamplus sp.]